MSLLFVIAGTMMTLALIMREVQLLKERSHLIALLDDVRLSHQGNRRHIKKGSVRLGNALIARDMSQFRYEVSLPRSQEINAPQCDVKREAIDKRFCHTVDALR